MVGGCLLVLYGKKGTGRNKWLFGAGTGTSLMAMELAVEYMLNKAAWEMALSIMKGGAIFSVIVLLGYVREWFGSGRDLPEEKELLHPVRQWMKEYQESFLQLSRSFCMTPQPVEGLDRGERLLQLRLAENRMAAAGQIQEMSQILEGAMERIYGTQEDGKLEQEIGRRMKLMGVQVEKVFFYGPRGKKRQIYLVMKTRKKICVPVKKVAGVLSELLDCEMMPDRDSRTFVGQERITVLFVEGTAYNVLYGVRKAVKKGEVVSGDNFSVFWLPDGRFYAGLSDGMGSGSMACKESEMVLDLVERFLEAGFSVETAIRMMNSAMVMKGADDLYSTVDLCKINLYTGMAKLYKIGAAATFIKRGAEVECITSQSLPVGAQVQMDISVQETKLTGGDFVVMVTDGVLEYLHVKKPEDTMQEIIESIQTNNPGILAKKIMERVMLFTGGKAKDDMTVLAACIWEK